MANSGAIWGIDIGNCALKALRCRRHEKDTNRLVVEAFDFVEYSKILTQPEADREELIREAIATFVSRNELTGDSVAISVPGQSGLSRFIKLPPVEAKKIPDIVKYEARQQIPFALEDVVWDYQQLAGGSQEEDYALDPEVGLFAMKRDQVHRALEPLTSAGIEVDYIQLAPLAIYNFACFDRMNNLEDAPPFDPEKPPKSLLVLSFGTETTDLVVTNGFRVWQRNIPIGGSHFTRALTRELQLTFTKAEHLKRNATKAEDPKALFQAMRPVFSDLVAEIQRSIGFFMNNNKKAEIGDIVALGNPMKLPGLQRYLSQNLEQKVLLLDEFPGLVGGSVTAAPQFQTNHLSFAEAYGLCVQGLGLGQLNTNLLPEEIITKRLVQGKKPWAVAAAALLMLGIMGNYFSYYSAYASANTETPQMKSALSAASGVQSKSSTNQGEFDTLLTTYNSIEDIRRNLRSNDDGRLLWLELTKAISAALPTDDRPMAEKKQTAKDVRNRTELHIEAIDCEFFPEVSVWFNEVKRYWEDVAGVTLSENAPADDAATAGAAAEKPPINEDPVNEDSGAKTPAGDAASDRANVVSEAADADPAADPAADETTAADAAPAAVEPTKEEAEAAEELASDVLQEDFSAEAGLEGEAEGKDTGPTGEGWIIQISGFHLHNNTGGFDLDAEGGKFLRETLIKNLKQGTVKLPNSSGEMVEVSMKDLGISYPLLVTSYIPYPVTYDPSAADEEEAKRAWSEYMSASEPTGGNGFGARRPPRRTGDEPEVKKPEHWKLKRYDFVVQFLWQPVPRTIREHPELAVQSGDEYAADEYNADE